jgi:hypothetical protein
MTPDEPVTAELEAGGSRIQARTLNIPRDSLRTVFLEMIFSPNGPDAQIDDKYAVVRGTGTGFLYREQGKTFIITARHNLTGRGSAHGAVGPRLTAMRVQTLASRTAPPAC